MRLLAIDGNSIINRAYYGIRLLSTKNGIFTNAILGFLNILMRVENEVDPDAVVITFDMAAPTFRHEAFDDYKAGRKGMPEELAMQLPLLKELLGYLGYAMLSKEGWEADDILGTLAETCRQNNNECVIATGDRDSFQLVGEGVSVRLAFTKGGQPQAEMIDEATIKEKYGLTPKQLIDVKALMGDASDNIPGVKGIGEKTALGLIQSYGSLDAIYAKFDEIELKPAVRRNLEEHKETAYMSRHLAEIDCCAPVDTNIEHFVKKPVDNANAYPFMAKLELFSQMEKLGVYPPREGAPVEDTNIESPFEIMFDEITKEVIESLGTINVLFDLSDDNKVINAIALVVGDKYYYQSKNTMPAVKLLLESSKPKRTNGIKNLWHWAFENDVTINNVVLDAEIAAYILNPNAPDYNLERLYAEYGSISKLLDSQQEKLFPLLGKILNFTQLCDELRAEIDKNNQDFLLEEIELPLAEVLANMERTGIAVDSGGIKEFGKKLDITLEEVQQRIYNYAGEEFNINSPKQMADILFVKLKLPPGKKTKTGYSTNVDVLENLKHDHPIINDILEYRQYAKLKSTYVDGLLAVVKEDGRIHTTFQQTLTRTGRISSTEPNLQNIPIKTPLGSELRRFFIADKGYTLLDSDYSQIELRVLAHLSQDKNMIEAFKEEEDIHTKTAARVFNMPDNMVTPLMRSRAKAVNFGIVYGIGAFSLSQDIGVKVSEADDYIKEYLSFYSGVKDYMDRVIKEGTEKGYVTTMFGRRRYLPELTASNYNMREFGKRVARNTPIQGSAADIIKIAMIKVYQKMKQNGLKARLILQVHDELMVEALPEEAEAVKEIMHIEMEQAATLLVPLVAEVNEGSNWLEI